MGTPLLLNRGGVLRRGFIQPDDLDASQVAAFGVNMKSITLLWDSISAGATLPAASLSTPTLSQNFKHLLVIGSARSAGAVTSDTIGLRMNGFSSSTYYWQAVNGNATTVTATSSAGVAATSSAFAVVEGGSASLPAAFGGFIGFIPDYANVSLYKHFVAMSMAVYGGASGQTPLWSLGGMETAFNTPVTSLTWVFVSGANIAAGSRFSVYGVG